MSSDRPEHHGQLELSYRTVSSDTWIQTKATVNGMADRTPAALLARSLRLAEGQEVLQLIVDPAQLPSGYRGLDNEILAGRCLGLLPRPGDYPPQVSRLIGYNADSADPFALLELYRGKPIASIAGQLTPAGQQQLQVSLLIGLRWLAEAGIAHRAIGPDTVRWDGHEVQITDFSRGTLIAVGRSPQAPRSPSVQGSLTAQVSDRDDVWAALQLCYYIAAGQPLADFNDPSGVPELGDLAGVIASGPRKCPSAQDILRYQLRHADPVPPGLGYDEALKRGEDEFYSIRGNKHPETRPPEPARPPPFAEAPDHAPDISEDPGQAGNGAGPQRKGRGGLLRRLR